MKGKERESKFHDKYLLHYQCLENKGFVWIPLITEN